MNHSPLQRTGIMTLEPDGAATGCNPVQVGSTPTGVSDCPTAGSDYINQNLMSEPFLRWMVLHYCPTACRDYIQIVSLVPKRPVSIIPRWALTT